MSYFSFFSKDNKNGNNNNNKHILDEKSHGLDLESGLDLELGLDLDSGLNLKEDKKTINIEGTANRYQVKKLTTNKTDKKRVITSKWNFTEDDLTYINQLKLIEELRIGNLNTMSNLNITKSQIEQKISSYKQQDIEKNRLDLENFITFDIVISLLEDCKLYCDYCSTEVLILYEKVRESRQWTLDRIDNNIGHNIGNVIISCLQCNLKRRRTDKDSFMFTKKLSIVRNGFVS